MEKVHELKIQPQYFKAVVSGKKNFELRKNDRGFKVGDILILKECESDLLFRDEFGEEQYGKPHYTGNEIKKTITYILEGGNFGLHKDYCILGLGKYVEKGSITDEEIDTYGKFSDYEKKIIKEQYSKCPKGTFPNPRCALY
jgi:hypothetical protein